LDEIDVPCWMRRALCPRARKATYDFPVRPAISVNDESPTDIPGAAGHQAVIW